MDISTMIVDLLRNGKENEILNRGGPIAKPAPLRSMMRESEAQAAGEMLGNRAYYDYKREAQANGDPILSPEEFKRAQAEGRY